MDDIDDWNAAGWAQQEQDEEWLRTQLERDMPKVSDMVQSKYLRKEDIEDDTPVTIRGVREEDLGQQGATEKRWVIYFKEFPKGMVLNVTTIRVLESAFGDEADDWKGKSVLMYVDPNVSFQGRVVGGLRIRVPRPKAAPAAARKPTTIETPLADDLEDEIPF